MARPCPICVSDPALLAKVNALIASGESANAVAVASGFNKFAIQRHKRHAFPAITVDDNSLSPLARSEKRLNELASRAEQSWLGAVATGDARGALDVLKSQIRLALDLHSRLIEKAEQATEAAKVDNKNTPEHIDELLRLYREKQDARQQKEADLIARGYVRCPLCSTSDLSGNWVHPSAIATLWKPVKAIYDKYCDEAERKALEVKNADNVVH
jgi:hypothetical protein